MGDHGDAAAQAATAALSRRYDHLSWIAWSNTLVHVVKHLPADSTLAWQLEHEIMYADHEVFLEGYNNGHIYEQS